MTSYVEKKPHVTLKGSYVKTLSAGAHTITIGVTGSFSEIDQDFVVAALPNPSPDSTPKFSIPNTGIENNHSLFKLSSLSIIARWNVYFAQEENSLIISNWELLATQEFSNKLIIDILKTYTIIYDIAKYLYI